MDQHSVAARKAALEMAYSICMAQGVTCDGCILKMAENFASFIAGGTYHIDHAVPPLDEDDEPQGARN